jgi:hypothetical protein
MSKTNQMKSLIVIIAACLIAGTIISGINKKQQMLRHVVLFKFKDDAGAGDVKKVEDAFRALPSKIKEVKALEWGTNNSPEGLSQEFTHCFFVSFKSEADRAVYLPHPAHKAFVDILTPHLDKVLVLDYWAKD